VKDSHPMREAGAQALYGLRGKGNLGDENNALLTQPYRLRQGLQVDLGLTASGNPVQQKDPRPGRRLNPGPQAGRYPLQGRFLSRRQG